MSDPVDDQVELIEADEVDLAAVHDELNEILKRRGLVLPSGVFHKPPGGPATASAAPPPTNPPASAAAAPGEDEEPFNPRRRKPAVSAADYLASRKTKGGKV